MLLDVVFAVLEWLNILIGYFFNFPGVNGGS